MTVNYLPPDPKTLETQIRAAFEEVVADAIKWRRAKLLGWGLLAPDGRFIAQPGDDLDAAVDAFIAASAPERS